MADDVALRNRRSRAHRRGDHSLCRPQRCPHAAGVPAAVTPLNPQRRDLELVETYRSALADAGRLDTPEGVHVMALAELLAAGGHGASGAAALSKELRAAAAEAFKGAARATDRIDELEARRRKRAGA